MSERNKGSESETFLAFSPNQNLVKLISLSSSLPKSTASVCCVLLTVEVYCSSSNIKFLTHNPSLLLKQCLLAKDWITVTSAHMLKLDPLGYVQCSKISIRTHLHFLFLLP